MRCGFWTATGAIACSSPSDSSNAVSMLAGLGAGLLAGQLVAPALARIAVGGSVIKRRYSSERAQQQL